VQRGVRLLVLGALGVSLLGAHDSSYSKRRFVGEYRDILRQYATGDIDGALERYVLLETQASRAADDRRYQSMQSAKQKLHRKMRRASVETLPPLTQFQERAYVAYLERHDSRLAIYARLLATELAERYAVAADTGPQRSLASGMLASLGGYAHDALQETAASRLYGQSLELDPDHVPALLGLAALNEKRGEYVAVTAYLRRLVAAGGKGLEPRLRLAVNLSRVGPSDEAKDALRRLVAEAHEDWIRSIAYQELARLLLREGSPLEARTLLARAVAELPCDPTLPIQLAYADDRAGRTSSLDLVTALASCPYRDEPAPRARYTHPPTPLFDQLRQRIAEAVATRLPTLAEALS